MKTKSHVDVAPDDVPASVRPLVVALILAGYELARYVPRTEDPEDDAPEAYTYDTDVFDRDGTLIGWWVASDPRQPHDWCANLNYLDTLGAEMIKRWRDSHARA